MGASGLPECVLRCLRVGEHLVENKALGLFFEAHKHFWCLLDSGPSTRFLLCLHVCLELGLAHRGRGCLTFMTSLRSLKGGQNVDF